MSHGEDFEKQEVAAEPHHVPVSRAMSIESALTEALDAEANIEPAGVGGDLTREKSADPGPPPNGGFQAWLQVAGSFFLFFNAWYVFLYAHLYIFVL